MSSLQNDQKAGDLNSRGPTISEGMDAGMRVVLDSNHAFGQGLWLKDVLLLKILFPAAESVVFREEVLS